MGATPARADLEAALRPLLPEGWRFYPYSTALDKLSTTVVMVTLDEMRPAPAAPKGVLEVDFIVTVVSHRDRNQPAEDELDDAVLILTTAMRRANIRWGAAKKVKWGPQERLAYDIYPVTVLAQPDPAEKE